MKLYTFLSRIDNNKVAYYLVILFFIYKIIKERLENNDKRI